MLNFRKIYEFFFSSFRIAKDTELVSKLIDEGERYGLVIKRSWIYGAFALIWLVPIGIFAGFNVYLLGKHFEWSPLGYSIIALLVANLAYSAFVSGKYVYYFRKTYRWGHEIRDLHLLADQLALGDQHFTRFFNQIKFNYFFFVGIIVFYVVHISLVAKFSTGIWAGIDVLCILAQLAFMRKFIRLMINLEMDFNVIVKGRIFFINQKGMYSDTQTLTGDKIKTIRATYPGFISSYFGHGTVDVLTEGDIGLMGVMTMQYVEDPEDTVASMNQLVSGRIEPIEKIHNVYLSKIVSEYGIDRNSEDFREKIRQYLANYEDQIRDDYLGTQDEETKREIEAIYGEYRMKP